MYYFYSFRNVSSVYILMEKYRYFNALNVNTYTNLFHVLFFFFPTTAVGTIFWHYFDKVAIFSIILESSATEKGFCSLQQSSTELESELFTPIRPPYYLRYLRSLCFHGSIYYALPQDHPVSSVYILLPVFHHLSTLILQQATFKEALKKKVMKGAEEISNWQ